MENLQFCTLCNEETKKTCCINIKSKKSKRFGEKCKNKAKYEICGIRYCGVHKNYAKNHLKLDNEMSLLFNNIKLSSNKRKNPFKNSRENKKIKPNGFGFIASTMFPKTET